MFHLNLLVELDIYYKNTSNVRHVHCTLQKHALFNLWLISVYVTPTLKKKKKKKTRGLSINEVGWRLRR